MRGNDEPGRVVCMGDAIFCASCGARLSEGARFCPKCGAATHGAVAKDAAASTGEAAAESAAAAAGFAGNGAAENATGGAAGNADASAAESIPGAPSGGAVQPIGYQFGSSRPATRRRRTSSAASGRDAYRADEPRIQKLTESVQSWAQALDNPSQPEPPAMPKPDGAGGLGRPYGAASMAGAVEPAATPEATAMPEPAAALEPTATPEAAATPESARTTVMPRVAAAPEDASGQTGDPKAGRAPGSEASMRGFVSASSAARGRAGAATRSDSAASEGGGPQLDNSKIAIIAAVVCAVVVVGVILATAITTLSHSGDSEQVVASTEAATGDDGQEAGALAATDLSAETSATTAATTASTTSAASTLAPAERPTTTYTNARFGYCIEIPEGFEDTGASQSNSGTIFEDKSLGITITLNGFNNDEPVSVAEAQAAESEGHNVTYDASNGSNWFVISYEEAGLVFYTMEYVGGSDTSGGSSCAVTFAYPRSEGEAGDALVEAIVPSFEPGDIASAH